VPAWAGADVLAHHERLCRLIAARTRLPLRDISARLAELMPVYLAARRAKTPLPTGDEPTLGNAAPLAQLLTPLARRTSRRFAISAVAVLSLTLLLYGGGALLQHLPLR
jgi:hypothetical protein